MICPNCGKDNNYVERPFTKNGLYRRRRKCNSCGERFITVERVRRDDTMPDAPMEDRSEPSCPRKGAINFSMLKNRTRPVWIDGEVRGWAIINDYEDGDLYVYTANGGKWLLGKDYRKKWSAYENVQKVW